MFFHLILRLYGSMSDRGLFCSEGGVAAAGNTFQNLRVSSPAPVTMLSPSGLIAK